MRYITFLLSLVLSCSAVSAQIIDSDITLSRALEGTEAPLEISEQLELITVEYYSTDSLLHRGQIVVDKSLAGEVREIFDYAKQIRYPIAMVIPIKFDMPDGMTSMANLNNTYSFHYRSTVTSKSKLSTHSTGRAIDFNPFDNPYISPKGDVKPVGARYDPKNPATLTATHPLVVKMKSLGWIWGGEWKSIKDYMHFEKP